MSPLNPKQLDDQAQLDGPQDPELLQKSGPRFVRKGWTFGSSSSLVEGAPQEAPWVSALWIVIPTGFGILLVIAMLSM